MYYDSTTGTWTDSNRTLHEHTGCCAPQSDSSTSSDIDDGREGSAVTENLSLGEM